MSDINGILNIGLSALQAAKTGVEVTAQNIANVDTPGYSQKEVVLGPKKGTEGPPYFFNGVEVSEIKRAYDEELAREISAQQSRSSYWQTSEEYLARIEEIFSESDQSGLRSDLDLFWNAWQKLSTNPSGYGERQEVAAAGNRLSETLSSRSSDLQEIMANINRQVSKNMEEINQILQKIAELNRQISESIGGQVNEYKDRQVNEYKDRLDKLIEDLSEQINVNYWQEKNGQVTVSLNGHSLVEGNQAATLTSATDEQGHTVVQKKLADGTLIDVTERINAGKVAGLLSLGNKIIPGYLEKLDKLAFGLSQKVNEQHQSGYGLDGSTGVNFFKPLDTSANAARNLALNPDIENNLDLIAASSSPEVPDNENAIKIADLQRNSAFEEGSQLLTANDYYASLYRTIGRDTQQAQAKSDQQRLIVNNLKDRRSMISDVALDEQLANLIKFQQTYNASAKIISTADQMMSTLLNLSI